MILIPPLTVALLIAGGVGYPYCPSTNSHLSILPMHSLKTALLPIIGVPGIYTALSGHLAAFFISSSCYSLGLLVSVLVELSSAHLFSRILVQDPFSLNFFFLYIHCCGPQGSGSYEVLFLYSEYYTRSVYHHSVMQETTYIDPPLPMALL